MTRRSTGGVAITRGYDSEPPFAVPVWTECDAGATLASLFFEGQQSRGYHR
jgi:hypothetical protein